MKKTVEFEWGRKEDFFVREAYNTLRTNVLFCGRDVKVIVITSCLDNEGKSTVSQGLAKGLANNGERVLLLDADLRKSVFAVKAKAEGSIVGLSQVLSGQVAVDDAIYETNCKGLDMIFAGPFPPNPSEMLAGKNFAALISSLREEYDHIIIDAAPLGLVVDASVIAGVCDGSILVVNRGQIKSRTAQNVKKQLERSGCRVLGVVLNQTTRRNARSSYGYYYYSRYGRHANYRYYRKNGYSYGYGYGYGYGAGSSDSTEKAEKAEKGKKGK